MDPALSSYTLRYWGQHFKTTTPSNNPELDDLKADFVWKICEVRPAILRQAQLGGLGLGHHSLNADPEHGLRQGYNAWLMVVYLGLTSLFPYFEHLRGETVIDGVLALHLAVAAGHNSAVDALLKVGNRGNSPSFINARDSDNRTPLMIACIKGHAAIVETLFNWESLDASAVDNDGWNALHHASKHGHLEAAQVLSSYMTPDQVNSRTQKEGLTARQIASISGHEEVAKLFRRCASHTNMLPALDHPPPVPPKPTSKWTNIEGGSGMSTVSLQVYDQSIS